MTTPQTHTIFAIIQNLTPEIEADIIKVVREGGGEFVELSGGRVLAVEVESE